MQWIVQYARKPPKQNNKTQLDELVDTQITM